MTSPPDESIERWSGLRAFFYSLIARTPKSNVAVVAYAGIGPGDRILDVGCGPGASLELARDAGAEVYGVDPSPAMVARALRRVPEATVLEASAESLRFPDGGFTHVWTIASFHHWARPAQGIAEARRVLARGGTFLVVERKLRPGKTGHGLSPSDAEALAGTFAEQGFGDCRIETLRAGRTDYQVVAGTA